MGTPAAFSNPIRNDLTDEWKKRGVEKGKEYAILTDEITRAWAGMSTGQFKRLKGLKKENLRDNMSNLELVLTMLAEAKNNGSKGQLLCKICAAGFSPPG